MANRRKKDKKSVGAFLTPEEKRIVDEARKKKGMSLAEFLVWAAWQVLKIGFITLLPHWAWAWLSGNDDIVGSGIALWINNLSSLLAHL